MTTLAEVRLWGRTIGAVALLEGEWVADFEYDAAFAQSGIQLSPLRLPLSRRVYRFPALPRETFQGLPGLLADSLPDHFGQALINAWLQTQGRRPDSFNAVERLCYIGDRGMGALEFRPAIGAGTHRSEQIQVDQLVELASRILTQRDRLTTTLDEREDAVRQILHVGTSAGGARAKAVIAWNPATQEVRSGQVKAGQGFEYWLLKFDGVSGNRDKELEDPQGYGLIEYAYWKMALKAGIQMQPCRILSEGGRHHFMTRRFDRSPDGGKRHMLSLCGLAHLDFNQAGAHSYEQALAVIRELGLPMADVEQMFRRMAFNVIARNQDDHVKNIAFLMDRRGHWSLAPAFDVTYSYNPSGTWTASHQMSLNGKRDDFRMADFKACAQAASMKRGRAAAILAEVRNAVAGWRDFADAAGVAPDQRDRIQSALRLQPFQ